MDSDAPPPVFRSFKRRRLARQSVPDHDVDAPLQSPQNDTLPAASGDSAEPPTVIPPIRRKLRARNMGLDVSAPSAMAAPQPPQDLAPGPSQSPKATSLAPIKFAPPTGLVKDDLERHM
jgi:hypothetical protein